jgi:hypothetical protein
VIVSVARTCNDGKSVSISRPTNRSRSERHQAVILMDAFRRSTTS